MTTNLELTHKAYEAALRGPYEDFLRLLDDEVRIELPSCLPHGGSYRGKAGARALRSALLGAWSKFDVQVLEYFEGNGAVIAIIQLNGTLKQSGSSVQMKIAEFWRFAAGRVIELSAFYFDTNAVVTALRGETRK